MYKKLAIFDNDGTLVDTEKYMWKPSQIKCFNALGYNPSKDILDSFIGRNRQDNILQLKAYDSNFPIEAYYNLLDKEIKRCIENEKTVVMPGVFKLLDYLKSKNIMCAVASSSDMWQIEGLLKNAGLNLYFDSVFSGVNLEHGKPAPDIFLNVLEHYGLKNEEAIIFEDSHAGALAAKNANIDLVFIPYPGTVIDEDLNYALKVYKQIDEAIELF